MRGAAVKAGGACLVMMLMAGCASAPKPGPRVEVPPPAKVEKPTPPSTAKGGGYYQDDGPGANPPPDIDAIPDAEPKVEPLHRYANDAYVVFGRTYTPIAGNAPYRATGVASWYGKKFHGQRTATGEVYDMYGMSAAHTTLPLPSYARVTNPKNGKTVIVRVNDRGPFHGDRVIDLSYTAAAKLGLIGNGSGTVEVERIDVAAWQQARAATPRVTPATPEAAPDIADYWLQFGAFSVQSNAENLLARLQSQLGQIGESVRIVAKDGLFRLRAGPFKTAAEANALAAEVKRMTDVQMVVLR